MKSESSSPNSVLFEFDDRNEPPQQPRPVSDEQVRSMVCEWPLTEETLPHREADLRHWLELAQEQAVFCQQRQDQRRLRRCLRAQELILQRLADWPGLLRLYQQFADIARRSQDRQDLAWALFQQARVCT